MRPTLAAFSFLALLTLPSFAFADESAAPEADATYFLGAWDCAGFVVDPRDGEIVHVVGTWRFHPWAGGWITDAFESYAGNGSHYAEWGWSRYEYDNHAYVRHVANTLAGHGHYESRGWDGDTWTWDGTLQSVAPHSAPVINTITKKGPDHFWISIRYFDGQQTRRDLYKADCRRQAPYHASDCHSTAP